VTIYLDVAPSTDRHTTLPRSLSLLPRLCGTQAFFCQKKTVVTPLIKATHAWERLSIDYKGPVKDANPYVLIIVDEYPRFPFAFVCRYQSTPTVIKHLSSLFALFGYPQYIQGVSQLLKQSGSF